MSFFHPLLHHDNQATDLPVCPCCAQNFHHGAENCPLCGFSFDKVVELFGERTIPTRRVDDKAGCLKKSQRETLSKKLTLWEKKCPPAVFCIHIPLSLERQQLRQYATWALNNMALNNSDFDRPDWTLLLVLDISNRAATFSYGYKLDKYLTGDILYPALASGASYLRDGHYEQGLTIIMKKARRILAKQARTINANDRREERKNQREERKQKKQAPAPTEEKQQEQEQEAPLS